MAKSKFNLSEEQKKLIEEHHDKSLEQIVQIAKVSKSKARDYLSHLSNQQTAKKRKKWVVGLALAGLLSLGYVFFEANNSNPAPLRDEIPIIVSDTVVDKPLSRHQDESSIVVSNTVVDKPLSGYEVIMTNTPQQNLSTILNGIKALEHIFEKDKRIHIYSPSKYLMQESTKTDYLTILKELEEFNNSHTTKTIDYSIVNKFYKPRISDLLTSSKFPTKSIYQFSPAHVVLKGFLESGEETSYSIYYQQETEDICLLRNPDKKELVRDSLEKLVLGTAENHDIQRIKKYGERSSLLYLKKLKNKRTLKDFINNSLASISKGNTNKHIPQIVKGVLRYALAHQVSPFQHYNNLAIDQKKYVFIANMHNHNWGRNESSKDLKISKTIFSLVMCYNEEKGFYTRHLWEGKALDSGRDLDIKGLHQQWFATHKENAQPKWIVSDNKISKELMYYDFDAQYPNGISYVVFVNANNDLVDFEHYPTAPNKIHVKKTLSSPAPQVYILPQFGKMYLRSHVSLYEK